jgi:exonuclease III
LKIYYLNVCGLKSKLKFQEITDIIASHDIIIFVETKLDNLDILNVPNGYSSFSISSNDSELEYFEPSGGT